MTAQIESQLLKRLKNIEDTLETLQEMMLLQSYNMLATMSPVEDDEDEIIIN